MWNEGADALFQLHQKMLHIYDGPRCRDLHEQMWAICQALDKRDPSFSEVEFICTTPMENWGSLVDTAQSLRSRGPAQFFPENLCATTLTEL